MVLLFVVTLSLANVCISVDRGKFNKCENLNFCNEFFYKKDLDKESYLIKDIDCSRNSIVTAYIESSTSLGYSLTLESLKHESVRIRLKENVIESQIKHNLFDDFSYVFKDADTPKLHEGKNSNNNNQNCKLYFSRGKSYVEISPGPFFLKIFIDDNHTVLLNDINHLKLPRLSKKEETSDSSNLESVGVDINFYGYSHLYGLPEHTTQFVLNNDDKEPYRLFNLDVFEFEINEKMALYGSIPFVHAHSSTSSIGLLWLNPSQTFVSVSSLKNKTNKVLDFLFGSTKGNIFGTKTLWLSEAGYIDLFLFGGPNPEDVSNQYAHLTGFQQLPPMFSIAYHQCRWNYNDEKDVLSVHNKFDEYNIPVDVIWLDIEYAVERKYFEWDKHKFPNTIEMVNVLASKNRKLVYIVDPHIKADSNYHVYSDALSQGILVKLHSSTYHGHCWPGTSAYPDFFTKHAREWWSNLFMLDNAKDTSLDMYMWNDMNEPSVFNGPEGTFPRDVMHDEKYYNYQVHNLYGLLSVQATFMGYLKRSNFKLRPFILTRSFFAGSQKFGAMWTGDNLASWDHLESIIPMLLSLSISGFHFCGADVGGFFKDPSPQLLVRWYQAGSLQPFFRTHAHIETKRREPWLLDREHFNIVKDSLELRYTLLPYIYTLFGISHFFGTPIMRPIWFEFPGDEKLFNIDNQYMLGYGLLIMPVAKENQFSVNIYVPDSIEEKWCEFDLKGYKTSQCYHGSANHNVDAPLNKITVLQRPGSIIPLKMRLRRSSKSMFRDPITLKILLNQKNEANGNLYLDDEETMSFTDGSCVMLNLTFFSNILSSSINKYVETNYFDSQNLIERIIVTFTNSIHQNWKMATILSNDSVDRLNLDYVDDLTFLIHKPNIKASKPFNIMFK